MDLSFQPGLRWLLWLRWAAVLGQTLTCLLANLILDVQLPWPILILFLLATAATNLTAQIWPGLFAKRSERVCAAFLFQDALVLTGMLWYTGGAENPFAAFYLLHVAMAAMLLDTGWTWGFLGLGTAGYSLLFLSPHRLLDQHGTHSHSGQMPLIHLVGMLIAFVLVGASIALFVGQLRQALAKRDRELTQQRERNARNDRFAALATLSAGVAHELATPLSTIAIVTSDLERTVDGQCRNGECRSDARLIRTEVERCRTVLENLSERTTGGVGDPPSVLARRNLPERLRPYLKDENWQRVKFDISSGPDLLMPAPPLLQSLAALIKNGCEASPAHAVVCLSLEDRSESLVFSVEDGGHGIAPELLSRIGEPFFTTKSPGRGMGLGLFLVRTFVERMQGAMEIQSQPPGGTKIQLILPATQVLAQ